ncbi:conjugative transfer protein MobI(A/C) [Shewanella sp. UCD-KL12]|uniref:conjugative transfer protein MobI(A/C) n=1 Tax=Shewanella sp. UCD-KL12 TaxID=1917163 RepID=UPI0009710A57|nr:conjugative transfer protein MobI(A/C) [Shewanella sp. UCD-KL12]
MGQTNTLTAESKGEVILSMIKNSHELKDQLQAEVQFKVDAYWEEWQTENKRIKSLHISVGSADYIHTGRLAPRVYSPKNTHRVYLEWWDFKKSPLRKHIKSFGVRIKPTKKGYTWSSVSKHANSWEKKLYDKYEAQFNSLRISLNAICDHINHLNKILRVLRKPAQ